MCIRDRILAARSPAFAPPLIATVATGIPDGICTMEYKESLPPKEVVCIGIPMTGIGKIAAHIPGRCAAIQMCIRDSHSTMALCCQYIFSRLEFYRSFT